MYNIKHLMTGPEGNNEFCFPESLNVNIKCFVIPPNSTIEKELRRNRLLDAGWLTNLPPFQGARPDHVRVQSSSSCFPRELVKFVRPRELVSFDLRHVTRSPPIGKRV